MSGTLATVGGMATYINYIEKHFQLDNVMLFEVLNEPWSMLDLGKVRDFYLEAIERIREIRPDMPILLHDRCVSQCAESLRVRSLCICLCQLCEHQTLALVLVLASLLPPSCRLFPRPPPVGCASSPPSLALALTLIPSFPLTPLALYPPPVPSPSRISPPPLPPLRIPISISTHLLCQTNLNRS